MLTFDSVAQILKCYMEKGLKVGEETKPLVLFLSFQLYIVSIVSTIVGQYCYHLLLVEKM